MFVKKGLVAKLIIFILSSFLLIFWSSTSSYAAKEDFVRGCLKGIKSQEATTGPHARKILSNMSPAVRAAALRYNNAVLKVEGAAEIMCNDLYDKLLLEPGDFKKLMNEIQTEGFSETGVRLTFELQSEYFASGIKRLASEEIRPFFTYNTEVFKHISSEHCKGLITGEYYSNIGELSNEMLRLQSLIDDEIQISYYSMSEKALVADFIGQQSERPVGRNEQLNLEEKFGNYLVSYSQLLLSENQMGTLGQILSGELNFPDEEYCMTGIVYFGALATMPGTEGDKIRKIYIDNYT